jgi:tetratricopeptide (TPR) repeat protein
MKIICDAHPEEGNYLDTYANLLYKLGRTEEALRYEEKAFALAPNDKDITDNLSKMKKGEPTWPTDNK